MPDKDNQPDSTAVDCIICNDPTWLGEATAGSFYYDGRQAFACSRHIQANDWPIVWAMFEHDQIIEADV